MIERGLVIAGDVVPGTDWIVRDASAWWSGGRGTRARAKTIDLLVGHWTAGEASARRYDDDGPFIYNVMKNREKNGKPLNVGITFVIGACDPAEPFAQCWQLMDPGFHAPVQVGESRVNKRSMGVEIVSAGVPGKFDARKRPQARVQILGRTTSVLRFFDGQLRTWVRLAELLASLEGRAGISIDRNVPHFGGSRRFTESELISYSGAMEHLHVPTTKKVDAGGMLVDELLRGGWARA